MTEQDRTGQHADIAASVCKVKKLKCLENEWVGLKIRRPERVVGVRVPLPAPTACLYSNICCLAGVKGSSAFPCVLGECLFWWLLVPDTASRSTSKPKPSTPGAVDRDAMSGTNSHQNR